MQGNGFFLKNWVLVLGAILIMGGVAIWVWQGDTRPVLPSGEGGQEEGVTPEDISSQPGPTRTTAPSSKENTGAVSPSNPAAADVSVVVPVGGEIWLSGKQHILRWNREAGYAGGIALLDAGSKDIVGWLSPSILPDQVTYSWDTSSVSLSRTNPLRTSVGPGTYVVRMMFDGPIPPTESALFSIVSEGDERILAHEVSIQRSLFSPNTLTVKQGDSVIIVNKDTVSGKIYTLHANGTVLGVLSPKHSYVWNAERTGSYSLGIVGEPLAGLSVQVQ